MVERLIFATELEPAALAVRATLPEFDHPGARIFVDQDPLLSTTFQGIRFRPPSSFTYLWQPLTGKLRFVFQTFSRALG
jgi:hypothetical protein